MPTLETERLRMIPFTREMMLMARSEQAHLAQQCHIHIPKGWPDPELAFVLPRWIADYAYKPAQPAWEGLIIRKQDHVLIGNMGLKGGPDETGRADVGYTILPAFRNQGYATEMLRALITWAFTATTNTITTITAECYSDNDASIRVLKKVGLHCQRHIKDLLYWNIDKTDQANSLTEGSL
jgi:ribosomal-protein-alanine N-acetyltransferase